MKPANFLLTIGINPMGGDSGRLVAPYEPDSARWPDHDWYRHSNSQPVRIDTQWSGDANRVLVETFRDVLLRHVAHPEAKFLDPTGGPCLPGTRGLLQRRPTMSTDLETIGKEASLIEKTQAGLLTDDPTPIYRASDPLWQLIIRALRSNNGMRLLTTAHTYQSRPRDPVGLGKLSGTQIKRMVRIGGVPRDQETRELIRAKVVHEVAAELVDRLPSGNWLVERDEVVLDTFDVMNLTAPLEPGDSLHS